MTLEITPELKAMVRDLFLSGNYAGENEILHEALVLLSNRDRLRRDIRLGLAELDRGERHDGDDVFRYLEEKAERITSSNP
jgi:Arc/MetJ-type ribon-helix-helix transcriptional regulator